MGRRSAALSLLARIRRVGASCLPAIVRARCDLLEEAASSAGPISELAARRAHATGLNALRLYIADAGLLRTTTAFDSVMDDVVGILDLCQRSEDEGAVLLEVSRRLRRRLRAAAVAIVAVEQSGARIVAGDGGRVELPVAERAAAAAVPISPHRIGDRTEAATPVRYGGEIIGALVARWTIGTPHDLSGTVPLLGGVAAAIAPILSAANARRRSPQNQIRELLGVSPAMADLRNAVERAAPAPFPVLVTGESGSGKELVARALHRLGPRRDRSFCALNCAALPDDLVEAELFGYARGAFTGAVAERPGVFEEAHGGTLFLDEIGELSLRAQAKVLRVVQDGELRRIGENVSRRIDVRLVSATNRTLQTEAAAGRFRFDLLYRLDVVHIAVPPLRERREDIPFLAEHFWREAAARVGSRATLGPATLAALARYDWPGNVRELQNIMASLAVRSPRRGVVPPIALGPQFGEPHSAEAARLDEARRRFEERFVRAALVRTGGHRAQAAAELGITRQGLTKLMTRLGIGELPDGTATS
jgi:DNA-binding NtrC family response regulator